MRVVYVARHDSGGNDDEGAIAWAFEQLNCEVVRVQERSARTRLPSGDLLLYHKYADVRRISEFQGPRAMWYFDLVDFPDRLLQKRCAQRIAHVTAIERVTDFPFYTDGDWVLKDQRRVWLPQGFDSRQQSAPRTTTNDKILFTGVCKGGGSGRESFVAEMHGTYGLDFYHVSSGVHGHAMAELIANYAIVVAPDAPVTDLYWSNRVYNALGYGAFLLHPACVMLKKQYIDGLHLMYYRNRGELHRLIQTLLHEPDVRRAVADAGHQRTLQQHTYLNRVKQMLFAMGITP